MMSTVMAELAMLGVTFHAETEGTSDKKRIVLSAEGRQINLTQGAMKYLGELDSSRYFVGLLHGVLVVREL